MIKIINKEASSNYYPTSIPKAQSNIYTLTLKSEAYFNTFTFGLTDEKPAMADYIYATIDFSDVPDGEYRYIIASGDEMHSNGMLYIGENEDDTIQYQNSETFYEYDPESGEGGVVNPLNLAKVITAFTENGSYLIPTPTDFDGIKDVEIAINVSGGSTDEPKEFLYNFDYEELDYDFANEYFERHAPEIAVGGCSAVRSGNFVGRHLDWKYDWEAMAFIRTPHNMGVAGGLPSFTIAQMESGLTEEQKKILPFMLQDGINEYGLFAEINVVPAAGNTQTPGDERICSLMLVRYILDHYDSVDAAIEGLSDKQIFFPTTLTDMGYESHYMIADSAKTAVLEIIDNALMVVEDNVSTNYHLYGVSANTDGTVNTPETAISGRYPGDNGIEEYGTGLERYNTLKTAEIASKQDMENALKSVLFTKAYTEPWYSEFVGVGEDDITVDTPANDPAFVARIEKYQEIFANRSRETALTWNTCHASIYDLENKILYLKTQEKDAESVYRWYELGGGSYEEGYASGYTDGHADGYTEGVEEGYEQGESDQKAKLVSTAITANGTYRKEDGYNEVSVNVPQTILQSTAFTENGSYVMEDGYAWSEVDVNVPTANLQYLKTTLDEIQGEIYPEAGYDGLSSVMYDANGVYTLGYNSGVIIGHENGVAEQKGKLVSTAITANGTYTKEDGYNSITVNVDTQSYYNEGYADGETAQKAKLVATAITANGTYTREDGFNEVTVNVPKESLQMEITFKRAYPSRIQFSNWWENFSMVDEYTLDGIPQPKPTSNAYTIPDDDEWHTIWVRSKYIPSSSRPYAIIRPGDYRGDVYVKSLKYYGENYNITRQMNIENTGHTVPVEVQLGEGLVELGESSLYSISTQPVLHIPFSTKIIGGSICYNDTLTTLYLGDKLTDIVTAIYNCRSLNTIYSYASIAPTLHHGYPADCFEDISSTGTLHYPAGSDYSTWIAALPSGWTAIGDL